MRLYINLLTLVYVNNLKINTINRMEGIGVRLLMLISAMAPGRWPLRAPTKNMRDELKMQLCKVPSADIATRI